MLLDKVRELRGLGISGPLDEILSAVLEEQEATDANVERDDPTRRAAYFLSAAFGEKAERYAIDIAARLRTPFANDVRKMVVWLKKAEQRMLELERYGIMDTDPEMPFDDIAFIAAHACSAPFAAVNLIDRDRQWSKAVFGGIEREKPVEQSVCGKLLDSHDPVVLPDLTLDDRTSELTAVTQDGARFYASAPIWSGNGVMLGRLCVVDYEPRSGLSYQQTEVIDRLARQVTAQLELRRILAGGDTSGFSYVRADREPAAVAAN